MTRSVFRSWKISLLLLAVALSVLGAYSQKPVPASEYSVLAPISSGNLTIFPVVSTRTHDTGTFLTLDDGVRSGQVIVTESYGVQGLQRRQGSRPQSGGEVNRLVLINNSDRPLLLLAGEIVTGGKQDRVIGADRIVPAKSDPVDLSVFCVEPGRWVARSEKFSSLNGQMAQPSVRRPAMARKDQAEVWNSVRESQGAMAKAAPAASGAIIGGTTSYAGVVENRAVQDSIDKVAAPIQQDYEKLLRQLRERNATGVVVAINGRIVWADLFSSPELLHAYWPKLVRSYAAEAVTSAYGNNRVAEGSAASFLAQLSGTREVVETEPGVYRRSEISGDGFKVFNIVSLLGKSSVPVHLAKMADGGDFHPAPGAMIR